MLRTTDEAFIRMKEEYKELSERVTKLDNFIKRCRANEIKDITIDEIHLLEEQRGYMIGYQRTLSMRIGRVEGE